MSCWCWRKPGVRLSARTIFCHAYGRTSCRREQSASPDIGGAPSHGSGSRFITTEFGRGYRLALARAGRTTGSMRAGTEQAFDFPPLLSPLVGRSAEIEELDRLVVPGSLVTITGIGGVGKSRLAIELGHRHHAKFSTGGCFVELASLADADLVFSTIASRLRLEASNIDQLKSHSRGPLHRLRTLWSSIVANRCWTVWLP